MLGLRIIYTGNGASELAVFLLLRITADVAALRIEQLPVTNPLFHDFLQSLVSLGRGGYGPAAAEVRGIVGQRTYQGYFLIVIQRQDVSGILKQYESLGGDVAGNLAVLRREDILCPSRGITILIRILEKS